MRRGQLTILTDVATADAGDLQAFSERLLPVIEQEIYNRLSGQASIESYAVAGRSVSKIPIDKLYELRGKMLAERAGARSAGKLGVPVRAVFARPGA